MADRQVVMTPRPWLNKDRSSQKFKLLKSFDNIALIQIQRKWIRNRNYFKLISVNLQIIIFFIKFEVNYIFLWFSSSASCYFPSSFYFILGIYVILQHCSICIHFDFFNILCRLRILLINIKIFPFNSHFYDCMNHKWSVSGTLRSKWNGSTDI